MIEQSKYKELIEGKTSFFLDANILLELYRVSTATCISIMEIIDFIRSDTWIPKQAYDEFLKNKDMERAKQFNKYKNVKKDLQNCITGVDGDVRKRITQYKKYEYPKIDEFENNYKEKIRELKEIIENYLSNIDNEVQNNALFLKSNDIENFVNRFQNENRILKGRDIVEKIEIIKEGKIRYEHLIPPGYKDIDKSGTSVYGDLFLWKEILEYANGNDENVVFITNDEKEDWWDIEKDILIGPRHELVEEFKHYNSKNEVIFLNLKNFFTLASHYHNKVSFASELELNAYDYIHTSILDKFDTEITEALMDFSTNNADYDSVLEYAYNDLENDGIEYEYSSHELYFKEETGIAEYFITVDAMIYTSHSYEDREGHSFTLVM